MVRIIPKEVKEEILEKVKGGRRVSELSKEYAISEKTIYKWLQKQVKPGTVSILKYNRLKRENEELKRIIGMIVFELERGKKNKNS